MMKKFLAVILVLVITAMAATAMASAITLDNSGGIGWKYVAVFPFSSNITESAQYCIHINANYINITNSTGSVKASLYDPSFWDNVNATGADIRVTNQSSQIYFWISEFNETTKQAKIWVNVPIGSNELKLYYGNALATKSEYDNGNKTFLFFDDFSTNTIGTKWTQETGTWKIEDGYLTLNTSYPSAPGNIILSSYSGGDYVAYITGITGSREIGVTVNTQDTSYFGYFAIDYYNQYLIAHNIWDTAWGTYTGISGTVSSTKPYTMRVIVQGTTATATNMNTSTSYTLTGLAYSSGYLGLHITANPAIPAKYKLVLIASLNDPATFQTPSLRAIGTIVLNATIVNVTYRAYDITGELLVNNSTATLTPTFRYAPSTASSTGYLAVGSVSVPGAKNITFYLNDSLALNKVICNGTIVTPNYIGTTILSGKKYKVYNFTSPSAGLLVISANATPVTKTHIGCNLYRENTNTLPVIMQYYIENVNKTYGANVTYYINTSLNVTSVIYNGTAITPTYVGNVTINGGKCAEYKFYTNSSGLLKINMSVPNLAMKTKVYADNSTNFTEILCGEQITITTPVKSDIYFGKKTYNNTTKVTTYIMYPNIVRLTVNILNKSAMEFGYFTASYQIVWGKINLSMVNLQNKTVNFQISIYNPKFNTYTSNTNKLFAGWNKIIVYYMGQVIKEHTFYLNHSNQGENITLHINDSNVSSPCYLMNLVSPTTYKIYNLHKIIPYGKFAINHSGEVIIKFINNTPDTVTVDGKYAYYPPYLFIYGSGNTTVTPYYKLTLSAESALGIPMNLSINLNNTKMDIYGTTNKIIPVNRYVVEFPKNVLGFELINTSLNKIVLNLTKDTKLPTATYKVPTKLTIHAYKINVSWVLPFPIPYIPFGNYNKKTYGGVSAKIIGELYNWYNAPVPHANITIKIISDKTGYTITKVVNTKNSGEFSTTFNVSYGVNYTILATYDGSPIYVGSSQKLTVTGGELPSAPSTKVPTVIYALAITVLCISIAVAAYVIHKRSISKAQRVIEKKSKFFKRVK